MLLQTNNADLLRCFLQRNDIVLGLVNRLVHDTRRTLSGNANQIEQRQLIVRTARATPLPTARWRRRNHRCFRLLFGRN